MELHKHLDGQQYIMLMLNVRRAATWTDLTFEAA